MDLAQATKAVESIELDGREYPVRFLEMWEWGDFCAWLKKKSPSPVTVALFAIEQARNLGEPVGQASEDKLLDHAQRAAVHWPPRFATDAWFDAILGVEDGDARLLLEILGKADPTFDAAKAKALVPKVSGEQWRELLRVALRGGQPRPKGEGGTAGATT